MSMMTRIGVKSIPLSIIEVAIFFAATAAFFLGVPKLYVEMFSGGVPMWLWLVMGVVYLLIVMAWWAPGDEKADTNELIAFGIVTIATAIAVGIYIERQYGAVSSVVGTFVEIVSGEYGKPS